MKALLITQEPEPLQLKSLDKPKISGRECLVRLNYGALNRRDQWIREGKYPGIRFDTILGSDGCGVVEEGSDDRIGKEVILNPNVSWGENPIAQSADYSVLGMPINGTLAEYIKISEDRLIEKPEYLSSEEASALPLAGLTAFRALFTKGQVTGKNKVLITGIGGGVAQFVMQFATAIGAEVYVTSGSNHKIKRAIAQGALGGFDYSNKAWVNDACKIGGFDIIIDSAGGDLINSYLKLVKPGGRIIVYGSTSGTPRNLDVFRLFWSQAQIMGSTMGNDQEFSDMVNFAIKHQLKPTIDEVYDLKSYLEAFDRFKSPDHFGKIVLKID